MSDLATFKAALTSIKSAMDIAKGLRSLDKQFNEVELKIKIVELLECLVDAKDRVLTFKEENIELRHEVNRLRQILETKDTFTFENGVYWLSMDGIKDKTPFCQRCYDSENKSVRLQKSYEVRMDGRKNLIWECKACKSEFNRAS